MTRGPARRWVAVVAVCGVLTGGVPAGVGAQGITQQQADGILKELRGIHELLQKAAQPPAPAAPTGPPPEAPAKLERVTGYILGRPDAPLTMVEFTDLQCPYCYRFATQTFDAIKNGWIDTGRLRFLSRDFPLPVHPQAQRAARASRRAGEQVNFWELRTDLVRNAASLSPAFITERAAALTLDMKAFTACVESPRFDAEIAQDQRDGSKELLASAGSPEP
jgi:protein-disulfide isomerase